MVFDIPFENTPSFPAYQSAAEGVSAGDAVGKVIDISAKPGVLFFPELMCSIKYFLRDNGRIEITSGVFAVAQNFSDGAVIPGGLSVGVGNLHFRQVLCHLLQGYTRYKIIEHFSDQVCLFRFDGYSSAYDFIAEGHMSLRHLDHFLSDDFWNLQSVDQTEDDFKL